MREYYLPFWIEWILIAVTIVTTLAGIVLICIIFWEVGREEWLLLTGQIGPKREDKSETARIITAKAETKRRMSHER